MNVDMEWKERAMMKIKERKEKEKIPIGYCDICKKPFYSLEEFILHLEEHGLDV
jgi:hypothetical protein